MCLQSFNALKLKKAHEIIFFLHRKAHKIGTKGHILKKMANKHWTIRLSLAWHHTSQIIMDDYHNIPQEK